MTDEIHVGYTFKPSLQDISLKRFRLRYSSFDDCYYLHWDDIVCPQLARINGLKNGLFSCSGVRRCEGEDTGELFLTCEEDADSAHVEWRLDFSSCGLVILNVQIKMGMSPEEEEPAASFLVRGDNVLLSPQLGNYHTQLDELSGSKKLSITASIQPYSNTNLAPRFLSSVNSTDNPLDIIIDLMCPRSREDVYCGEILLGIKFGPEPESVNSEEVPGCMRDGVLMRCHPAEGQLQVHVVEAAGVVDEITHKPFKTVVKCNLLPNTGRFPTKHTNPRYNAYPTWTENFIFNGVTREELVSGGLEVILYDHHHFSSDPTIGGLRICTQRRKDDREYSFIFSPDTSPRSRSMSPLQDNLSAGLHDDSASASLTSEPDLKDNADEEILCNKEKSKSLPHIQNTLNRSLLGPQASPSSAPLNRSQPNSPATSSPPVMRSRNHLSPNLPRLLRPHSIELPGGFGSSPKSSPISLAKNLFRFSGSHIKNSLSPRSSPRSSPRNSPLLGRKKIIEDYNRGSEFVHWWMDNVTQSEVNHWSQVLEKEGEWIYSWHSIRHKLKAV